MHILYTHSGVLSVLCCREQAFKTELIWKTLHIENEAEFTV